MFKIFFPSLITQVLQFFRFPLEKNSKNHFYYIFLSSSSIILISSIGVNFFNYLFQISSARLLSIDSFGILQTVLNLIAIATIFTVIIRLQLTKVLTKLVSENQTKEAGALVKKTSLFITLLGGLSILFFLFIEYVFQFRFGLIQNWHIITVLIVTTLTFYLALSRSLMRAYLMFVAISLNSNLQAILRLIFTVPILLLSFKLNGALFAIVLSYLVTLIFSYLQLKDKLRGKITEKVNLNLITFSKESIQTMVGYLGLTALISVDMILVQQFLPSEAGYYAGLMLFGKAVVFTTTPFSTVLFPMIIKSENKNDQAKLFILSIILVALIGGGAVLIFKLFATTLVPLLLSKSYLSIVPYLPLYTLFITFYSISYVIINGLIALNKFSTSYAALVATIFQIAGIIFYHNNIEQVIMISLLSSIALTFFCIMALVLNAYRKN